MNRLIRFCVYALGWLSYLLGLTLIYRLRRYGSQRVPKVGGVLIASNHQSYFDPPIVGVSVTNRRLRYLARASLFRNPVVAWLLGAVGTIPLRDNEGDLGAIKAVLAALDAGEAVLVFPEGSRTFDGSMQEFKRGIALLLKRSKCPVMPVAIEGAFDAFPRDRALPKVWRQRLAIQFGAPIPHDELLADGPEAALQRLHEEIEAMRLELRSHLRSATKGRFPPPGPGDA